MAAPLPRRGAAAIGVGGAALVMGPALGSGALLSLDLVLTPQIPFPDAALGGGYDLPRRVPLGVPLAWASEVVGGPTAGKLLLVTAMAAAFIGVVRLVPRAPAVAQIAGGVLYAFGPFLVTRVAAGHWAVVAATAVLPFALPTLLQPSRDPARTFVWLAALGATGVLGGLFGGAVAVAGLLFEGRRRPVAIALLTTFAQLPWLVPGLLVRGGGLTVTGGDHFTTASEGPLGPVGALLAQHGFWRNASQVGGGAGIGLVLVGIGFLALALVGTRDLPRDWRAPLALVSTVGFIIAAAPALPLLRDVHTAAVEWAALSPIRESQRVLPLFLVWEAPCVALGLRRVAHGAWNRPDDGGRSRRHGRRAAIISVGTVAAFALAAPGAWGAEGRLRPVEWPGGWHRAADVVAAEPATVLALPWHQYFNIDFAGGRRVLNPLPDFLGGDVVSSHDPELDAVTRQESTDPREATARRLIDRLRAGEAVGSELAALGVGWVVLVHQADWHDYAALYDDPRLTHSLADGAIDVFAVEAPSPGLRPRVRPWNAGLALSADGAVLAAVGVALVGIRGRRSMREDPVPQADPP